MFKKIFNIKQNIKCLYKKENSNKINMRNNT